MKFTRDITIVRSSSLARGPPSDSDPGLLVDEFDRQTFPEAARGPDYEGTLILTYYLRMMNYPRREKNEDYQESKR